jgi:hypothetical protein
MSVLHEKHLNYITDLNLSYNLLETDPLKRSPDCLLSQSSQDFLQDLTQFVEESRCITHLDISGMQMGTKALDLVKQLSTSDCLRVVHLNNNMISYEVKKYISNMLIADYGNLKKE